MAEVADFKERLTQAMVTLNAQQFSELLLTRHPPLPTLLDRQGYTSTFHLVVHELSMCLINEDRVLEFFEIFRMFFANEQGVYFQDYVNVQTKEDKRTALQIAVQNNRTVRGT